MQCPKHGAGYQDRIAAVVLLAYEVEFRPCLNMAREAVLTEAVIDFREATFVYLGTLRGDINKEELQSRVTGLKPFCCLIITSFGISYSARAFGYLLCPPGRWRPFL